MMQKTGNFLLLLLLAALMLPQHPVSAEQRLETDQTESLRISSVEFKISGTSNVRDWDIETDEIHGVIIPGPGFFASESEDPSQWFEQVALTITNQTLDSGISAMTGAMHGYLKTEEHPEIHYTLEEILGVENAEKPGAKKVRVRAVAQAAGNDHTLEHDVLVIPNDNGSYEISGMLDLKFSDFEIDPPTFMRGALRTANDMKVAYKLIVSDN